MRKFAYLSLLTLLALTTCKKAGDEPKEVPMAPTELTLAQESGNQIKLTWKDNANNETGFKIERIADREDVYQLIGTVGANTITYTDNNVQPGSTYSYRVYAYNATGKSVEYSNGADIDMCPFVTTDNISLTSLSSALVYVNIRCEGVLPITSRGVVWSTSPKPTVTLSTKTSESLLGGNRFSSTITNLLKNATIYVRAYATNSLGTAYGNEGVLYTPNYGITVAGGNGSGRNSNQLSSPVDVAVDKDGNIYIADPNNFRVQKWAPGATSGTTFAGGNGPGPASNQLFLSTGVCIDASGNIYVVDFHQGYFRVQKWAPGATSGTTVASGVNQLGGSTLSVSSKYDVFVDGVGNIYVADFYNHRVEKWATGATIGTTVAGGNGKGAAANQLDTPTGVCVDAAGNIYVADFGNHRVQKWAPGATSGTLVAGGNGKGSAANQLGTPTGVCLDAVGNIYVADFYNHRVQKWAPGATSGTTVAGGSGNGSSESQLSGPRDLILDLNGNIYIADAGNHRILKWAQ
jgi:sugar lactone lactonase YvrE